MQDGGPEPTGSGSPPVPAWLPSEQRGFPGLHPCIIYPNPPAAVQQIERSVECQQQQDRIHLANGASEGADVGLVDEHHEHQDQRISDEQPDTVGKSRETGGGHDRCYGDVGQQQRVDRAETPYPRSTRPGGDVPFG